MNMDNYADIFGDYVSRIVGETPIVDGDFNRELEILEFVKQNRVSKFVAVDDDCRNTLFSSDCSWLFKTNYFCGLDEQARNKLARFINNKFYNN
jgi:hypothetical protein